MKCAVLISHVSDIGDYSGLEKIYHEEYLCSLDENSTSDAHHFYALEFSDIDQEKIDRLAESWFTNSYQQDLTLIQGISMGQVMHPTLFITLNMVYREYKCLEYWLNKFDIIYVSRSNHQFFNKLIPYFGPKIRYLEPRQQLVRVLSSTIDRELKSSPNSWKVILLYCLQTLFVRFLQNKILFINDWTYKKSAGKKPNALVINYGINVFKAAFFGWTGRNHRLPDNIVDDSIIENIRLNLTAQLPVSKRLLDYISCHINDTYIKNKKYYEENIFRYINLIKRYSPSKIIFPAEMYEPYVIGAYICRLHDVEPWLCLDGFLATPARKELIKYRYGDDSLFAGVLASGQSNYDYYSDGRFKRLRVLKIEPPLLDGLKKDGLNSSEFEIMFMSLMPLDCRLKGLHGSRVKSLVEMLLAAKKLAFKTIAIKLKDPSERIIADYSIKISGIDPGIVSVLSGPMADLIKRAKMIVGGMSTTLAEATFMGIPYIVYEPVHNGYSSLDIKLSRVVDQSLVARNLDDLVSILESGKSSVCASSEYMFDGTKLENLNF